MLPFVKIPVLYWLEISASATFLFALISVLRRKRVMCLSVENGKIGSRHARRAVAVAADGVMVADLRKPGFPIVYANQALTTLTHHDQNGFIGNDLCDLLRHATPPELDAVRRAMGRREATRVTVSLCSEGGETSSNDLYIEPQFGLLGRATHCIGMLRGADRMRQIAPKLQRSDQLDRLTGVASNDSFQEQLVRMLRREAGRHTLVVRLDVRRFHEINTSFGSAAGDALLREIGQRLRTLPNAVIGRLGGDQFAVAVALPNQDAAQSVIAGIQAALGVEFLLPDAMAKVLFAIGYAVGQRADDVTALLGRAAVALHEAKASPFIEVRAFDRNATTRNENRARLTRDLQRAIKHGELMLYYQPKVELATGKIMGAEALLRWDDPSFGVQEPNSFIPVAEESGLIVEIGAWSLRRAAAVAVRLNRKRLRPMVVSVNVSKRQFEYADVPQFLETVIRETGLDPKWLMLELPETVLTDNSPTMIKTMRKLRDMGFGLSIDDFGTGYSSLGYLEAFPFSEFKIDRTFVSGIDENRPRQLIVEAMIRLGRELQISVTAEGPETEAELAVLRNLNCPYVQGYIFGRPMSEDDFTTLVDQPDPGAADATTEPAAAGTATDTRNAILIDDDPLVREVIGEALEVLGWDVTPFANAEAALAMSDVLPTPRLIVTDVNLGAGMSGFELLPHARQRWSGAGIIVISGRPVEQTDLGLLCEHEVFLTKPASIAVLGDAITKVVTNPKPVDRGPADGTPRPRYDASPKPIAPPAWDDLSIDGAVALAPDAATTARPGTQSASTPSVRTRFGSEAQTSTQVLAVPSRLNIAAEVRELLSQMARPANRKTVRLLVAIEPDINILADPQAFKGLLTQVISHAIADTGASGGRVLLTAFPDKRTIRLVATDEAEAADPARREAALRHAINWDGIPNGSLSIRPVADRGVEVTVTLAAA